MLLAVTVAVGLTACGASKVVTSSSTNVLRQTKQRLERAVSGLAKLVQLAGLHIGGETILPFLRQKILEPAGQLPERLVVQPFNRRLNILNRAHAAKLNDAFQLGKGEIFSPGEAWFFGGVDPQLKLRATFGCSFGAKKACQKLDANMFFSQGLKTDETRIF